MSNSAFTVEQFRRLASASFSFLEEKGFSRMPNLEEALPTGGTLAYLGKHVGFIFSLDLRDECVDAQVVRVWDGRMKRNWEGGYSADLFTHLVGNAGYRGRPARSTTDQTSHDRLQRMIDEWAQLLKDAGESLLSDKPESLPV